MRTILFLMLIICLSTFADDKKSCCGPTATAEFAAFGKDIAFVSLHESPAPFNFKPSTGEMKTIKSPDSISANIYEVRSAEKTDNFLLVFHEWWGLNDYIKQEAEQWQSALGNVNVIAVDLYDGKVASVADSAKKYVGDVNEDRARTIIAAVAEYIGKEAKIATLGWCFGGGWSMQSALLLGKQSVGCVIYYGMPEKDVKKLKTLNCDVLGIFAKQDGYINPGVVLQFEKSMKDAKKKVTVKSYDAVHAFANPSNPKYDKEKTANARSITMEYLLSKFK